MNAKAEMARAWSRWSGVYVFVLMVITWWLHLMPLVSGAFVGSVTFATAALVAPSALRGRIWMSLLAAAGVAVVAALATRGLGHY
jgi:hypothetical protein